MKAHVTAKRLSFSGQDVGEWLLRHLSQDGRCDPSHKTLAREVGCCVKTVHNGINRLRELGLLRWERRIMRNGWRAEQTSNAYELLPDGTPLVIPCDGKSSNETRKRRIITDAQHDQEARASVARQLAALGITAEQAQA